MSCRITVPSILRLFDIAGAYRAATREIMGKLRRLPQSSPTSPVANRRRSLRGSAATPVVDDDTEIAAMETLLKIVRVGAAPVSAFRSAWKRIVTEDRAGCQEYFLQLNELRQRLEQRSAAAGGRTNVNASAQETNVANSPASSAIASKQAASAAIDADGDAMETADVGAIGLGDDESVSEVDKLIMSVTASAEE